LRLVFLLNKKAVNIGLQNVCFILIFLFTQILAKSAESRVWFSVSA